MFKFENIKHNGDATVSANVHLIYNLTLKNFIKYAKNSRNFRLRIFLGKGLMAPNFEMQKYKDEWHYSEMKKITEEQINKAMSLYVYDVSYNGGYGQDSYWLHLKEK